MNRIQSFISAASNAVNRLAAFGPLALISVVLLIVIVAWLNPAKLTSYMWVITKLLLAAVLGETFYRATRHGSDDSQDSLESSMAQNRRAMLIASAIIASGMMP